MRGYTLKLFWWFWLTAAAAGFAHHMTTMIIEGDLFHEQMMANVREIATVYGERLAAREAAEGAEKAGEYMERLRRDHRFFGFLFDEDGKELLGQRSPDTVQRLAEEARRTKDAVIRMERGRPVFAVPLEDHPGLVFAGRMSNPYFERRSIPALRLVAAALVAGLLSWILAVRLARPIRTLRGTVQRFAAGELGARAETIAKRRDEIGGLAKDFNGMADRIEALLQGQRRLLADVSHELRSPLTRLGLGLELLRRRSSSPDDEAFGRMETELERIDNLIGSLLKLARLEALEKPEQRTPTDLTSLLEEIASDAAFEADSLGKKVSADLAEGVHLKVDPALLRRAVENVVRNAIRYTPAPSTRSGDGGEIRISLARLPGNPRPIRILVEDQGKGVPPEELDKIFVPFLRVESARERTTADEGIGLGLAIAHRAVALHGGEITARNRLEGGLAVEILLPGEESTAR
jgi:two-component system sensor histidine kinase CpxA